MFRYFITALFIAIAFGGIAKSQSSQEVIVQPANGIGVSNSQAGSAVGQSTSSKPSAALTSSSDTQSISAAIQVLDQIKAANDEVLAKQKGALERLDELQQAAEQLQIFAKRS